MNWRRSGNQTHRGDRILSTKLTAFALLLTLPAVLAASSESPSVPHYVLKDLGTLGGPNSYLSGGSHYLNSNGTIVGGADTADWDPACGCAVSHAFKWNNGRLTDLGTLPDGDNFSFAGEINSFGAIVGISSNGVIDPASIFGFDVVATLWQNGRITNLGTLGGIFSAPERLNDSGQIAGGASTTIPDPDNIWSDLKDIPSPTLWHAVLWRNGAIRDLGTLGGPASYAKFIDSRGRVAGNSYTRSIPKKPTPTPLWPDGVPLIHPFFWENGRMTDIGTLGGVFAFADEMNSVGQVVGRADLRGDGAMHAFLWSRGKMTDLGTIGDAVSAPSGINDLGAVVGFLVGADRIGGFLWRNGVMTDLGTLPGTTCTFPHHINNKGQVVGDSDDCNFGVGGTVWLWQAGAGFLDLNTLVPPESDMHLLEAQFIDDRGEIVGVGSFPNGDMHVFALIPQRSGSISASAFTASGDVAADGATATYAAPVNMSPAKLTELHARLANRPHGWGGRLTQ